jgi:hypothetical protein
VITSPSTSVVVCREWGFGSESRTDPTLRTPGINNFDFAVFKRTAITERVGLEFRTEFFNLFNHPCSNARKTRAKVRQPLKM